LRSSPAPSSRIALAFLAILVSAQSAVAECTKRELLAKSTVTIKLDGLAGGVREHPAFYLRDMDHPNVFFFKPEDVARVIEKFARDSAPNDGAAVAVLERIRRDLPLKEDTDLFKYAVRDIRFTNSLDSLVTELLDAGHADVDFWPLHDSGAFAGNDAFDPSTILRVQWRSRGGDGRKYCDAKGFEIFSITDTIND
jgi:hypothetical protein